MKDCEWLALNTDEYSEEQARDICIKELEEYVKSTRKDNALSIVLYLIEAFVLSLIFGEATLDGAGPSLLGGSEASVLRKLKKGKNTQSSIDYLKEIQTRKCKKLILDYVWAVNQEKSFRVVGQDLIWNCIELYENICKENPRARNARVDQAIESLGNLVRKIRADSLCDAEVQLSYDTVKAIKSRFEDVDFPLYQQVEAVNGLQDILKTSKSEKEIVSRIDELFQSLDETRLM